MRNLIKAGIIVLSLFFVPNSAKLLAADIPIQNNDAEILGVLSVIDQNEIQAAQLAEQKFVNRGVLDYARMIDMDNNEHLDMTRKLSQELGMTIKESPSLDQLRRQGQQDLSALTALDAGDFARLYIADVIKGHSEALDWLDIQDTQNEQVKDFLEQTRKYLTMHLENAQQIQEVQSK